MGVEEDSGGEGEDPILHEITVRRKKWLEEQEKKGKEEEEVKGPFKKRRARRRERKRGGEKEEVDEGDSDSSDEEGVDGGEMMGGVDLLGSLLGGEGSGGGWGGLGGKVLEKWKKQRRVVGFVGGLDLCDGRWDDQVKSFFFPSFPPFSLPFFHHHRHQHQQNHSLFRTLQHEHKKDFHNPWAVSSECGPREPWHDIHSKVRIFIFMYIYKKMHVHTQVHIIHL